MMLLGAELPAPSRCRGGGPVSPGFLFGVLGWFSDEKEKIARECLLPCLSAVCCCRQLPWDGQGRRLHTGTEGKEGCGCEGKTRGVTGPGTVGCPLAAELAGGDCPSDGSSLGIPGQSHRRRCTGAGAELPGEVQEEIPAQTPAPPASAFGPSSVFSIPDRGVTFPEKLGNTQ